MIERLTMKASTARVRAALAEVCDGWGARLGENSGETNGSLSLPVVAGLRRGFLKGTWTIESTGESSELTIELQDERLSVNSSAVMILLLSAVGGLITALWPWFPRLLAAAPLGLVLAVGGWLLVASRLRASGPEEFLAAVRAAAEAPSDEPALE